MRLSISPDGATLAVASSIGIWIYDAQSGEEVSLLTEYTNRVSSVVFSPDGQTIASASDDNTIHVWDVDTGGQIKTLIGYTSDVESVAFSPDGKMIASVYKSNIVRLWHFDAAYSQIPLSQDSLLDRLSFKHTVRLWDVATGRDILTLTGHTDDVNSVSFSPDGKTLASGSDDDTIRLWDVATGRDILTLTGHTDDVNSVSFSPDGKTLASAGGWDDFTVRLWDVSTGQQLKTLTEHTDDVNSVSFSPDGKTLASGSADRTVLLWELAPTLVE